MTTAAVTRMISSFRRQNTRRRSLNVKGSFPWSRAQAPDSGEPNNTLRTVAPPPRLLLAAQPLDGGVASHVISLVDGLPSGRFAVDVACPRGSQTWARLQGRDGVELHAIRPHRRPAPGDMRSWVTLLRLAGRADVVHVHSAKAGFLGRLAAATRGKRGVCVFTPHGWSFWAADGVESRLYVRLERLAARWCRTIVALPGAPRRGARVARRGGVRAARGRLRGLPAGGRGGARRRRPGRRHGRRRDPGARPGRPYGGRRAAGGRRARSRARGRARGSGTGR